jgi:hypothetical protein
MAEEEKSRDVTRRELAEALANATAMIAAQKEQNAALETRLAALEQAKPADNAIVQLETLKALQDLRQSIEQGRIRSSPKFYTGPEPDKVPYEGSVQATVECHYGHFHKAGDVFQVKVPALWSDDPYVAVIVTGTRDDGTPITMPNKDAPVPIDFRFRRVVSAAEDPTLRRASEY